MDEPRPAGAQAETPSGHGEGSRWWFTGGGTGGHVTPNLAIIGELRKRDPQAQVLYAGTRRGFEAGVVDAGIDFVRVPCAPLASPRRPLVFARMVLRILTGVVIASWHILRFRPQVVVASGGYVSVPSVLAARLLRRPVYIHEQNVSPGRANRLLGRLASRVGVTFPNSEGAFRRGTTVVTGYPVRATIRSADRQEARRRLGVPDDHKVAFIVGGSMGARSINRGAAAAVPELVETGALTIFHATGRAKTREYDAHTDTMERLQASGFDPASCDAYHAKEFFEEVGLVYAAADLVVGRAGAGTIMELATIGRPALLVPKHGVPGEHQLGNAMQAKDAGWADVLFEQLVDESSGETVVPGDVLASRMRTMLGDQDKLDDMARRARLMAIPDAVSRHADVVEQLRDGPVTAPVERTHDQVAWLVGADGERHEVLFRTHAIATTRNADLPLEARSGVQVEAFICRNRRDGAQTFTLHPRSGPAAVDGEAVTEPTPLTQSQTLTLGGHTWTFEVEERAIERPASRRGLGVPALLTATGTFFSRVFGFVRDLVLAVAFGASGVADIWFLGLFVSNWLRGVFAEMAIESTFLPTYSHLLRTGRTSRARRLLGSMLVLLVASTSALSLLAILTMPFWLPGLATGLRGTEFMSDAILVTRVMFPYLILVSLAALASALLRAADRYALPASSSILFSVGALVGFALYPWMGPVAFGVGVLLGGAGQLLVQLPALCSRPVRQRLGMADGGPKVDFGDPAVRKVRRLMPVILGEVSVLKAGLLVDLALVGTLGPGAIAAYGLALALFRLPFGVISQSLNLVVLRRASDLQADADSGATRRLVEQGIGWTAFLLLPTSALMLVLAEPTVRLLLEYGSFDAAATARVALALQAFSVGLFGLGLHNLLGRVLHARLEQRVATRTSFIALLVNVSFSISLWAAGAGLFGIAIATSLSYYVGATLRLHAVQRSLSRETESETEEPSPIRMLLVRHVLAVLPVLAVTLAARDAMAGISPADGFLGRVFEWGAPVLFGLGAWLASAVLLRLPALAVVERRFTRPDQRKARPAETAVNPYCLKPATRLLKWVASNPEAAKRFDLVPRFERLLRSRDWTDRNNAVKLAGQLRDPRAVPALVSVVRNRVAAPLVHRLLGGDYREPGFVRRNAVTAIATIGEADRSAQDALVFALDDRYWEVRTAAARAIANLGDAFTSADGRANKAQIKLRKLARGRNFEVAQEATRTLGEIGGDEADLVALESLHYHRNWRVRHALVDAYTRLFERGVFVDKDALTQRLDDILITSEGFRPRFILKESAARLQERLR